MKVSIVLVLALLMTACASTKHPDCHRTGASKDVTVEYDPREGKGLQMFDTKQRHVEYVCPASGEKYWAAL